MNIVDWLFVEYRFSIIFSIMDIIIVLFGYIVVSCIVEYPAYSKMKKIERENRVLKNQMGQLSRDRLNEE